MSKKATSKKTGAANLQPISREVLEATARIIGPNSAAAQALEEANRRGGDVVFYQSGNSIFVMKAPRDAT